LTSEWSQVRSLPRPRAGSRCSLSSGSFVRFPWRVQLSDRPEDKGDVHVAEGFGEPHLVRQSHFLRS
ncbi:hypothetical protein, partial [Frankia sp. Cas4]|uniref:hypothetical protein n=1 Tax=Frankia sp. Cas4 TaxID=3073927 RepID=UPI002AD36DB0